MEATLHTAANGHLTLNLNNSLEGFWSSLSERLVKSLGFKRTGSAVIGAGEQIHQSFERPDFTLAAGWDNWSGHYLLSESAAGDEFLKELFNELKQA